MIEHRNRPSIATRRLKRFTLVGSLAFTVCLVVQPAWAAPQPKYNGKIEKIGSTRLLRVWGEPEEMGFAHGFLLAQEIANDVSATIAMFYGDDTRRYERDRSRLSETVSIPFALQVEIEGIYEGLTARLGTAPDLPHFGRPLKIDDLLFFNSLDVFRAFGCSGFTVWGPRAGDARVITARNYDFSVPNRSVLEHQFILVRRPFARHQVATVTWPGYVGALTGVNDKGVAVFLHDGSTPPIKTPEKRYTPLTLALMEILESATPADAVKRTREKLESIDTPFSYLVRIVAPQDPAAIGNPETVLRIDSQGVSQNPVAPDRCITTNHYLDQSFNPPPGAFADSIRRYRTLETATDDTVTTASAWKALAAVSVSEMRAATLHAIVYLPQQKRIEVAFATWAQPIIPATNNKPVALAFDTLFKRVK